MWTSTHRSRCCSPESCTTCPTTTIPAGWSPPYASGSRPAATCSCRIILDDDEARAQALERAFLHGGLGSGRFRTWEELRGYFAGLELVEPGVVHANDCRPDEFTPSQSPVHSPYAGGIGRKP